jgi:hypothetical protein
MRGRIEGLPDERGSTTRTGQSGPRKLSGGLATPVGQMLAFCAMLAPKGPHSYRFGPATGGPGRTGGRPPTPPAGGVTGGRGNG